MTHYILHTVVQGIPYFVDIDSLPLSMEEESLLINEFLVPGTSGILGSLAFFRSPDGSTLLQNSQQHSISAIIEMARQLKHKSKPPEKIYWWNKRVDEFFWGEQRSIDGEIGIEIECEGTHLFRTPLQYWNAINDGSLRNYKGHDPVEYVFREPLKREEAAKALRYLEANLKKADSSVVDSINTSVHVHINVNDLPMVKLINFICMYMIFEDALVDFSGPTRVGNLFCLRAKDASYWLHLLTQSCSSGSWDNATSDQFRYSSCNLNALVKFNSLEFRSMRGTVDVEIVQTWVDILCLIKDAALSYDNPIAIVSDFQTLRGHDFLEKVLKVKSSIFLNSVTDINSKLWDGFRRMKDVAYTQDWRPNPDLKKKPVRKARYRYDTN